MPGPITAALERWKQGDASAQFDLEKLLRPFLWQMIRLVRRQVDTRLKARIDSVAIVNAALNSLLTGIAKDEFPALRNHQELQKVLTCFVTRILIDEVRFHT